MTARLPGERMLVIGPADLSDAVRRALPATDVQGVASALEGVWRVGQEAFDTVLLSMSVGEAGPRALSSLRELAPRARILLSCSPVDESLTRRFLERGADDYLLEPPSREEIESAFRAGTSDDTDAPTDEMVRLDEEPPVRRASRVAELLPERLGDPSPPPGAERASQPSPQEIVALAEIMMRLPEGSAATLRRLAQLVQESFGVAGVRIEIEGESALVGDVEPASATQPIIRDGQLVGTLVLGPPAHGGGGADPQRLAQYARLLDAVAQQVGDRERWRRLAHMDELSGLANRRHFDERLRELVGEAMQRRSRLSVFVFDIDNFKAYNDRHGHATGDGLIRELGFLLRKSFRERDVAARYGGDEFAVIFWDSEKPRVAGSQHPSEPIQLARRFCETIAKHQFKCLGPGAPGPVTVSGGLATFPWDGRSDRELVDAADQALLAAKQSGKNHIALAGACERPASEKST